MALLLKWTKLNKDLGTNVTNYKIYRSEVSREDAKSKTEVLHTVDGNTTSYTDTTALENKLYYYRVDTVTTYGTSSSFVKAHLWSNNNGIAEDELLHGDWESGYVLAKQDKAEAFRHFSNHIYCSLLRKYGLYFTNNENIVTPYVYGGLVLNGNIVFLPTGFSQHSTVNSTVSSNVINNVMSDDNRFFQFDGGFYCFDTLKQEDLAKHASEVGIQNTLTNLPLQVESQTSSDYTQLLDSHIDVKRNYLLQISKSLSSNTYGYCNILRTKFYNSTSHTSSIGDTSVLPFVIRHIR